MNKPSKVAVCSRSFSRNPILRTELLCRYPHTTFNESGIELVGDNLVDFLSGHDKAIIGLEKINANVLSQLPILKVISKYGVGLDMIDMSAMRTFGVCLGWEGGVNRRSVSELVIAFSIGLLRHINFANKEVLTGVWRQHVGGLLTGRTFGVIGCGFVGQDLIKILKPFECKVLVNDVRHYSDFYKEQLVEATDINDLLRRSDLVTLHVPLKPDTQNIINAENISLMKNNAILINTARGGLVDECALKEALIGKKIGAAAFDVFSIEPPEDLELLNLPNFFATPHLGGSSHESILAMGRAAIKGLDDNVIPIDL